MYRLIFITLLLCYSLIAGAWADYNGCPPPLTGNVTTSGCAATVGNVPSGATIADAIQQQYVVSTGELDASNTTTLAVITGLSQTLTAGKSYSCRGHISITTSSTAGAKLGLVATSSLSATSISRTIRFMTGTTNSANNTSTAFDATSGGAGATAAVTDAWIDVGIVVNVGGVINIEGAQNVQTTGSPNTAKFLVNSTFSCVRVN